MNPLGPLLTLFVFRIPAGEACETLVQWGVQAEKQIQLLYDFTQCRFPTPALYGRMTASEAITRLLAGTPLSWDPVSLKTVAVSPVGPCAPLSANPPMYPCLPRPLR